MRREKFYPEDKRVKPLKLSHHAVHYKKIVFNDRTVEKCPKRM